MSLRPQLAGWNTMSPMTRAFFLTHLLLRTADGFTHLVAPTKVGVERALQPYSPTNQSGIAPSPHVSWEVGTQLEVFALAIWPLAFRHPHLLRRMLLTQLVIIASFLFNDVRSLRTGKAGQPIKIMVGVNAALLVWNVACLLREE
jgi:hypothetical protein